MPATPDLPTTEAVLEWQQISRTSSRYTWNVLVARCARRADKVYVLAHATKLDHRPFHAWATLPLPWTLVTDTAADRDVVARLRAKGIDVIITA